MPTLRTRVAHRVAFAVAAIAANAVGPAPAAAQRSPAPARADTTALTLIRPARVFDGTATHAGWVVLVRGSRIAAAGPAASVQPPANAAVVDLPDATLLPGLIDAHSHVLLHPYNETPWDDQVLHESLALRVARATNHLRATIAAADSIVRGPADVMDGAKRTAESVGKGLLSGADRLRRRMVHENDA